MEVAYLRRKYATDRETDVDETIRCSSLTSEREEHLKSVIRINLLFFLQRFTVKNGRHVPERNTFNGSV
jgi:hypothetical protein